MRNIRRDLAVVAATTVIATAGVGGVVAAQASGTPTPDTQSGTSEVEETDDGPNQGPDVNPNEPGHQDADETGEAEGPEGAEEAEGAEEVNDGPDQGPDADPNEPGHQDADESGETE